MEAKRLWPNRSIDLLVSIGTGRSDLEPDVTGYPPEIAALLRLPQNSEQQHVDTLIKVERRFPNMVYHRFDPHRETGSLIAIDEMNFTKLEWLSNVTKEYLQTRSRKIAIRRIKRVLNGHRC